MTDISASLSTVLNGMGGSPPPPAPPKPTAVAPAKPKGDALAQDVAADKQAATDYAATLAKNQQNRDSLTPPKLELPPKPESTPTDPIKAFGSSAMWLAALGGLLSRNHLTTALSAAGGVLTAFHQGDMDAAQKKMDEWKIATENAIKTYDFQKDTYKAVMDRYKDDDATAAAQLEAHAVAFKDDAMLQTVKIQGMEAAANLMGARDRHNESIIKSKEDSIKLQDAIDIRNAQTDMQKAAALPDTDTTKAQKMAAAKSKLEMIVNSQPEVIAARAKKEGDGVLYTEPAHKDASGADVPARTLRQVDGKFFTLDGAPVSPSNVTKLSNTTTGVPYSAEERESAAAQVATGQPENQVIPGYGKDAVEARRQARKDAISQIQAEKPGMSAAAAGVELANRSIMFQAGKRSESQLETMLGATKQALGQLDFNIGKAKEEMNKLPSSDISPVINAIERGEEKWSGDPAYSGLFYYMHATAVESARILSGGQASVAALHQGAMDEAKQWANINMTPASFDEVGNAMKEEGANKIETYKMAIDSQKIGATDTPTAPHPPVPPGVPLDKNPQWSPSTKEFWWQDDSGAWQHKAAQ